MPVRAVTCMQTMCGFHSARKCDLDESKLEAKRTPRPGETLNVPNSLLRSGRAVSHTSRRRKFLERSKVCRVLFTVRASAIRPTPTSPIMLPRSTRCFKARLTCHSHITSATGSVLVPVPLAVHTEGICQPLGNTHDPGENQFFKGGTGIIMPQCQGSRPTRHRLRLLQVVGLRERQSRRCTHGASGCDGPGGALRYQSFHPAPPYL
jgi:hypothetical protein